MTVNSVAPSIGPNPKAPNWNGPMSPVIAPKDSRPKYRAIRTLPSILSPPDAMPHKIATMTPGIPPSIIRKNVVMNKVVDREIRASLRGGYRSADTPQTGFTNAPRSELRLRAVTAIGCDIPPSTRKGTIWNPTVAEVSIVSISATRMNQNAVVNAAWPAVHTCSEAWSAPEFESVSASVVVGPPTVGAGSPSGNSPMSSGLRRIMMKSGAINTRENTPR